MKRALRFLLTLLTLLGCTTILGAAAQETPTGAVFGKTGAFEREIGFWANFNAPNNAGKGLGNPFKGKTAAEIDEMFKAKGFEPRGPDPLNGKGR